MRVSTVALLFCGAIAAAPPPSWAETTWTVNKVIITGNKSVPIDKLMAVVQEHAGSKVTVNDITADRDAISKVLEDANVLGAVQPSMKPVGQRVDIIFAIDDQGVHAPVVTKVAPKLHSQIFEGNASVPSDTLTAASGLQVGQDLSDEKILAAENAVKAAYAKAKLPPGVGVNINGETKRLSDGTYDLIWHITETKAKKKKPSGDDEGAQGE
jgi:outer membrane protein assembly factor BamA